jgi:hypothetical protein
MAVGVETNNMGALHRRGFQPGEGLCVDCIVAGARVSSDGQNGS